MSVTPYIFDGGVLTAAATTQGNPVPPLTRRIIKAATITNTTNAPIAVTVYLVQSGGAAAAGNTMIASLSIPAAGSPGSSYPCPELINQGINAGGLVQALGAGLTFKYTAVDFV